MNLVDLMDVLNDQVVIYGESDDVTPMIYEGEINFGFYDDDSKYHIPLECYFACKVVDIHHYEDHLTVIISKE